MVVVTDVEYGCRACLQEVSRIRAEHLDDELSICNDRVKGSLKVTRAFGAGFLKQVWLSHIVVVPFPKCKRSIF